MRTHPFAVTICALFFLGSTACSDDPVPAPAPVEEERTPRRTSPPEDPPPQSEPFDPESVRLDLQEVAEGFEQPLGLVHAGDGSDRLFVVEQGGQVRWFRGDGPPRDFLDISDRVTAGGEQGLLGLAFHPNYEDNGRFYVNYTDLQGDTVISEFRATGDRANPGTERLLLGIEQPFANHNGGQLIFGPDGYLYITTGDGGSGGDPENNGQRLDTLLGKLLRVDVDERDAGAYGIPEDNPFVGRDDARPEIWAYGLRNPWRFSFDRATDDLWIADVGQEAFEEVNREPANSSGGRNYGWRIVEGDACFAEDECDPGRFVAPVMTYSHDFGCSITGGYVYRGDAFPVLQGAYVTGDFCSGNVWALPADARGVSDPDPTLETNLSISSFGEDAAGELYVTDLSGGRILRVTATAAD